MSDSWDLFKISKIIGHAALIVSPLVAWMFLVNDIPNEVIVVSGVSFVYEVLGILQIFVMVNSIALEYMHGEMELAEKCILSLFKGMVALLFAVILKKIC